MLIFADETLPNNTEEPSPRQSIFTTSSENSRIQNISNDSRQLENRESHDDDAVSDRVEVTQTGDKTLFFPIDIKHYD